MCSSSEMFGSRLLSVLKSISDTPYGIFKKGGKDKTESEIKWKKKKVN